MSIKDIRFSYERATGRLHADNPNHPGITEDDIRQVLKNPAYVVRNLDYPGQWLATGETDGKYPFLTVSYYSGKTELMAVTAFPPTYPDKRIYEMEYRRLKEEGEGLCTPAQIT